MRTWARLFELLIFFFIKPSVLINLILPSVFKFYSDSQVQSIFYKL